MSATPQVGASTMTPRRRPAPNGSPTAPKGATTPMTPNVVDTSVTPAAERGGGPAAAAAATKKASRRKKPKKEPVPPTEADFAALGRLHWQAHEVGQSLEDYVEDARAIVDVYDRLVAK